MIVDLIMKARGHDTLLIKDTSSDQNTPKMCLNPQYKARKGENFEISTGYQRSHRRSNHLHDTNRRI